MDNYVWDNLNAVKRNIQKSFGIYDDLEKANKPVVKEGEPITITNRQTGKSMTGHWRTMSGNRVFVSTDGRIQIGPDHVKEFAGDKKGGGGSDNKKSLSDKFPEYNPPVDLEKYKFPDKFEGSFKQNKEPHLYHSEQGHRLPARYYYTNGDVDVQIQEEKKNILVSVWGNDDKKTDRDKLDRFNLGGTGFHEEKYIDNKADLDKYLSKLSDKYKSKADKLKKAVTEFEDSEIRNLKYEKCGVFDEKGNLVFSKIGEESFIRFTDEECSDYLKNNIFTHNHPSFLNGKAKRGSSFSYADIHLSCSHNIKEVRAVSADGMTYSMTGAGRWPTTDTLREEYVLTENVMKDYFYGKINSAIKEGIDPNETRDEANMKHHHYIWTLLSKELGMEYSAKDKGGNDLPVDNEEMSEIKRRIREERKLP